MAPALAAEGVTNAALLCALTESDVDELLANILPLQVHHRLFKRMWGRLIQTHHRPT